MDAYLQAQIIDSLVKGQYVGAVAWTLVFLVLWRTLAGLKKEVKGAREEFKGAKDELHLMNQNFSKSLADGEKRFEALEAKDKRQDERITLIETFLRQETRI